MKLVVYLVLAYLVLASAAVAAPRLEFEVATVKPSAPRPENPVMRQLRARLADLMPPGTISTTPGRIQIRQQPLIQVVASAWSVRSSQVSAPKWMSEDAGDLFDIEARFPEGQSPDQIHEMLQSLLEERFGLKLHREQVSRKGYALIVGKAGAKLQPAAPPEFVSDVNGGPPIVPPPREPLTAGAQRSEYKGVTISMLAAILSRMVEEPVVDMTGLTGKYDVVLETSRDTSDNPGTTIFQSIGDLGLKLDPRKVQVDMLVIDEIRRTPSAN